MAELGVVGVGVQGVEGLVVQRVEGVGSLGVIDIHGMVRVSV